MLELELVPIEFKSGEGGEGRRRGKERWEGGERDCSRGTPRWGTQRGSSVLCVGGGEVIVVCVCTTKAMPRLGW